MSQPPRGDGLRYAPGLDGVRALAVLAVVCYHIGTTGPIQVLPGGYLGVDVFFVLSGYLITSLLLVEAQQRGRISIKNFYLRRARRLLPALYTMLIAVAAVGAFWLPQQAARLRGDLVASVAYVQNWWLILQSSSYFAAVGDRPPLLTHLWSLAVEEQFYLVWPLVLIAFVRWRARRPVMLPIVLAGVAASTVVGQVLYHPYTDPSRVYYGTDTRALAPLLGAALAIAVRPWLHRSSLSRAQRLGLDTVGVVALVGLGVTAATLHDTDELLYRGGLVAIAVMAAGLVAVAGHPGTSLARVLAAQPLRYLGERSYAIYLWHWPVCLLTRPGIDIPATGWSDAALRLALSVAIAEASYHLIEKPIRRQGFLAALRRPRSTGAATATVAAVYPAAASATVRASGRHAVSTADTTDSRGVTGMRFPPVVVRSAGTADPTITAPPAPQRHGPPRRPLLPLLRTVVFTVALVAGGTVAGVGLVAASRPAAGVAIGSAPTDQPSPSASPRPSPNLPWGARVEFFGDSLGNSLLQANTRPPDLAYYIDAVDATTPGCGLTIGILVFHDGTRHDNTACGGWPDYWTTRVDQDRPALSVIMIGSWELFDVIPVGATQTLAFGSAAWDTNFRFALNKAIGILRARGGSVALALSPCYRPPLDWDQWYPKVGDTRVGHINDLMTEVAMSYATGVYTVLPPGQFCTDPAFATDTSYRVDGVHYTAKGASLYFQTMLPQILGPRPTTPSPTAYGPSIGTPTATP